MRTVVATLNAKYIHSSLAVRLLYVASKDTHDICFREFTIKEDVNTVADQLLALECDIIGLGVYIWNVKQTRALVARLKSLSPQTIIVLGGPEVSYEPDFFINNWQVDYIISGEGEFVLDELIQALEKDKDTCQILGVSSKNHINKSIAQADIDKLTKLDSPYTLPEDITTIGQKLVYFETSRGCPYQCQYCLSSLEKGVRYFPAEYIQDNLHYLIKNGARQIKFLDRTFNLNKEHTRSVFDFLIQNHREGLVCQFEIYADILTDEMINYLNNRLPENYFRFEIGIQSTHNPTNVAVKRKQDFGLLAENIKKIMAGGKIDLHLDLIAGLPYETYELFVRSFNDVFALGGKEVQLGFLKMLRGTNIRKNALEHGYVYDSEAPYQIIENKYITAEELDRIHETEHMLDKYWNSGRFCETMKVVFDKFYQGRYFEFFDELAHYSNQNNFPKYGYLLQDLFRNLYNFLLSKEIDLMAELQTDYYDNFKIRPNAFFIEAIDKKLKKRLVYEIGQDKEFLQANKLSRSIIEKQTMINPVGENTYLLTVFLEKEDKPYKQVFTYKVTK